MPVAWAPALSSTSAATIASVARRSARPARWPARTTASGTVRASPPATNAWTSESGARDRAPTCSAQPAIPTAAPTDQRGERSSDRSVVQGRRALTAAAEAEPACCSR